MTTLPALPPSPAPVGLPSGTGPAAGSDGGAFAGLLDVEAGPLGGEPAVGSVSAEPAPGDAPALVEDADALGSAPRSEVEPSAAQIIVAAQVTPVGPMLANAPRLTASYGEGAPASPASPASPVSALAPSSPTKSSTLAPETELFVGHLGSPVAPLAGSAGQVAPGTLVDGVVEAPTQQVPSTDSPSTDGPAPEPTALSSQGGHSDSGPAGSHTGHQHGTQAGTQAGTQRTTEPTTQPTTQPGTEVASEPGLQPVETQTGSTPAGGPRPEASAASTQPTAAQTNAVTGLTGTGPAAATTAPTTNAPAGTAPANPVAGQVFPEVTRLISRGDGTRRITLQLSPEALGDVRVVLTVRGGEVQVRMSGGELAQQALLAGAPELHKLLDLAGATSSQIQVGTQSSQGPNNALNQTLDQHAQRQDARNDGEHTQNHRTAGTRDGDTSARDGAPRGTHPHPATNPGTRTRIAGVDVTM